LSQRDNLLIALGIAEFPLLGSVDNRRQTALQLLLLSRHSQGIYATRRAWFEPAVKLGAAYADETTGWYHDLERLDQPEEKARIRGRRHCYIPPAAIGLFHMWLEREIPVDRKVGAVLSGYKRRQCSLISIVSSYSKPPLASSRIDICCIIVGKRPSSGRLAFVGQPRHGVWARHGHFILFAIALDRLLNGVLRQFIIIHTRLLRF
jgi:hypothetical protein